MGYSIQIRHEGELVIPEDAAYVPPNPACPNYISLAAGDMTILIQVMVAAGVLDREIRSSKDKKKRRPGTVPVYKFCWNEGYVVTAKEAGAIAEALSGQDVLSLDFLTRAFPNVKNLGSEHKDLIAELIGVWLPYNRVAAANQGYTIK